MKLKDCEVGMKVKVYDRSTTPFVAEIVGTTSDVVKLYFNNTEAFYYPEQLRKIVKNKPEMLVVVGGNHQFVTQNNDINVTQKSVDKWKAKGFDVWLMRGVRKL